MDQLIAKVTTTDYEGNVLDVTHLSLGHDGKVTAWKEMGFIWPTQKIGLSQKKWVPPPLLKRFFWYDGI